MTLNAQGVVAPHILKGAAHARNYGASELMLATMTGRYPPPHDAMDEHEQDALEAQRLRELEEEAQDFFAMVDGVYNGTV